MTAASHVRSAVALRQGRHERRLYHYCRPDELDALEEARERRELFTAICGVVRVPSRRPLPKRLRVCSECVDLLRPLWPPVNP